MDFTKFYPLDIIDSHIHFIHPERLDDLLQIMHTVPFRRANLVCTPNPQEAWPAAGANHNPAALFFKKQYPERVYISGALDYRPVLADPANASAGLAGQVIAFKRRGFDGLKLIEGKPQVRKLLPLPLDGPTYAGMWAALENEGFPVVFHVADPDEFWDAQACPDWARQSGWDYSDGSYPSKEDLYAEVERILARHPTLKIIFAHFYFLSADLPRAARFLDAHPSVCFDLAPHLGMYADFCRQPAAVSAFFHRYSDRILYGTDIDTRVLQRGPEGFDFMLSIAWLIRSFLEKEDPFTLPGGADYCGLGLPESILTPIYRSNFERLYGDCPAPLRSSGN